MALTERRIRYETLIRYNEDGRIGAHQVDLDQVLRDGVVINSTPTAPMPLSTADYEGVVPLADILGETLVAALTQLDARNAELEQLHAAYVELSQQHTQVSASHDDLLEQLAQANATIANLQETNAQLASERVDPPADPVVEADE